MNIKKDIAISDSGFVFDPTTGESYSLNPLGVEILTLLKDGDDQKEITNFVLQKYEVDSDTFENNYYDFLNMLKQFNLTEPQA
jgi:type IV secretory pathway TraG/TraD family ATPase VirD4